MNRETILEIKNLSKSIGKINIVKNISFHLNKGEIKGLLGPNGSGKTTILKMLVGLLRPTSGSIKVQGKDIQDDFERAIRNVGAIIENPELYEYLSGYDNLQIFYRSAPDVPESRVEEVIELLGMDDYIDDKVKTYSLGMLQRLGLAQAMLHRPAILLLDEPTNGLDPSGIQDLRKHLKMLADEGTAIIISSHLLAEIEMICDSVLILDDGMMVSDEDLEVFRNDSDQESVYRFKVLEVDKLKQFIAIHPKYAQSIEIVSDGFSIHLSELEVATVNQLLVENNISVVGIEKYKTSLEQAFLARLTKAKRG
ncbi:ABC transporter ATP-binding protein [Bacillus sp. FJAT-45350]|uniref:ABC transporter ATP-binding protein n=1 Tax=Bacillus sp. FJAT-45350 TaxID=2011014 RepID=UPI000BB978C5|nr:ABC transporter ATP-binding protein [Bacillus sp. FJAT-45350]